MNNRNIDATRDIDRNLKRWEENPNFETFLYVRDAYWQLITQTYYVNIEDCYVTYAPKVLEVFVKAKQPITDWYSAKLLDLLSEKDNLQRYLALDSSRKGLAWLCLQRSISHVMYPQGSRQEDFQEILKLWTKADATSSEDMRTDAVIKRLYGKHSWDLYGTEIHDDIDPDILQTIVLDIFSLDLPYAFEASQEKTIEHFNLPGNISV